MEKNATVYLNVVTVKEEFYTVFLKKVNGESSVCGKCIGIINTKGTQKIYFPKCPRNFWDVVHRVCYIGNLISSGEGWSENIVTWIRIAWRTFRELFCCQWKAIISERKAECIMLVYKWKCLIVVRCGLWMWKIYKY